MKKKISHPTYKDIPLARCGNVIFLGDVSKSHIVKIDILSSKKVNEMDVPNKLNVQLVNTSAASRGALCGNIKSSEKHSLFASFDLGYAWLQRTL